MSLRRGPRYMGMQRAERPQRPARGGRPRRTGGLAMEFKLELVLIPVTDVDRAKAFYTEQAEPGGVTWTTRMFSPTGVSTSR